MNRAWDEAVRANPTLFDGPAVSCADLVASETALGRDPELDRIALVHSPAELARLSGPHVDYLEPVVRRYATQRS